MQRRAFLQSGLFAFASAGASIPALTRIAPRLALVDEPLRLGSNENPLGPSPAALHAIQDGLSRAHRYPFAVHRELVDALAQRHGVAAEQVVLGAGSSEVLQMAVQVGAGLGGDATLVLASPTYEDAQGYAAPARMAIEAVPLRADHAHDLERMRKIAGACKGPVVVYVCNPNNPTGTVTPAKELDDWIGESADNVTFLVDEAYVEFAEGAPGFAPTLPWVQRRANVVVARTFSKIHGLAGMRVGYALAHRDMAARLRALQSRHNCNVLGLLAALASLADDSHARASLRSNAAARDVVTATLRELGLGALPSHANFVMHEIKGDVGVYAARMREAGILVGRPFPPLLGHNRLSLGTPEQMARWAETLRDFRKRNWV